MATKDIILRQHLLNGRHKSQPIQLSLDSHAISYGVYLISEETERDGQFELTNDLQREGCAAALHTEHSSVYVEALNAPVFVQSSRHGFDENSASGHMPLRNSCPPQCRVLTQLDPGESVYVGSLKLSIVSQTYQDVPLISLPLTSFRYQGHKKLSQRQDLPEIRTEISAVDSPLKAKDDVPVTPDDKRLSNRFGQKRAVTDTLDKRSGMEEPVGRLGQGSNGLNFEAHQEQNISSLSAIHSDTACEKSVGVSELDYTTDSGLIGHPPNVDSEEETHGAAVDTQDSILGSIRANMTVEVTRASEDTTINGHLTTTTHEIATPPSKPSRIKRKRELAGPALLPKLMRSTHFNATREESLEDRTSLGDFIIKVLFATSSSMGASTHLNKFLRDQNVQVVNSIQECTALCIGKGEVKKTSKTMMAIILGRDIITDDWATDSVKANKLLDLSTYKARDPVRESEWGVRLEEAVERGRTNVRCFDGWTVTFTQASKKELGKNSFNEVKELVMMAGARTVNGVLPKKLMVETPKTLVIATTDDPSVAKIGTDWRCFTREIICISILHGRLDMDCDQFLVSQRETDEPRRASKKHKR